MLYSSGIGSLVNSINGYLGPDQHISRRLELSEPKEIDEKFIRAELGYEKVGIGKSTSTDNSKLFARPRGPVRKR
jgi:twinfilin